MLPRWRYGRRTDLTAEFSGDPRQNRLLPDLETAVAEAVRRFRVSPQVSTASDAVQAAVVYARTDEAKEAAQWLLSRGNGVPDDLLIASRHLLNPASAGAERYAGVPVSVEQEAHRVIAMHRLQLRTYPHNVGRWLDLSRAYAVLGLERQSWRAMRVGLALTPTHRVTQRVAARLLVHLGRADEAHALVIRNPATRTDPWLLALEITLAQIVRIDPYHVRSAQSMIQHGGIPPAHLTELASALGTFQFQGGDTKRARKLFRLARVEPTENTLAQLEWMAQKDSAILPPSSQLLQNRFAMEARCWHAVMKSEWTDALVAAEAWQCDEAYSGRPAIMGSFIALSLLDDASTAIRIAEAGLRADSGDQLLRNNYVVALAHQGNVEKALEEFRKIRGPLQPGYRDFVRTATAGLLAFAAGIPDLGRRLYENAADAADSASRVRVWAHWIEAEWRFASSRSDKLVARLTEKLDGVEDPVTLALAKRAIDKQRVSLLGEGSPNSPLAAPMKTYQHAFPVLKELSNGAVLVSIEGLPDDRKKH